MARALILTILILLAAVPVASAESALDICPDTYCGERAYPDPNIGNGFFGAHRLAKPVYGRSWYLIRTLRPVYIRMPGNAALKPSILIHAPRKAHRGHRRHK